MNGHFPESPLADQFVPYYFQIANLLRRRIELGDLAPGMKLPNEHELAGLFGVSKMPVRQALSLLASEGLLRRRRGQGTFVAENLKKPKMLKLTGIIEDYVIQGMEGTLHLLAQESLPAPPQLADFFQVPQGEEIVRFRRVREVEDTPICYVSNYLRADLAKRVRRADLDRFGMFRIIEKRLGLAVRHVQQTIEARTADSEVAEHLSLEITAPVMYVETFVYGDHRMPLEFSQNFFRGDRYKYSVDLMSDGRRAG